MPASAMESEQVAGAECRERLDGRRESIRGDSGEKRLDAGIPVGRADRASPCREDQGGADKRADVMRPDTSSHRGFW